MSIDQKLSQTISIVANRILRAEPWASGQLAPHAGGLFTIELGPLCLRFGINLEGLLCTDQLSVGQTSSVTIRLSSAALFSSGPQRLKHVKIQGDAALAHALGEVAQKIRIDPEQALASIVGNIAARRINQIFQLALEALREQATRIAANLVEFAVYEDPVILGNPLFEDLRSETRILRDQIERLSKRIALLEST